MPNESKPLFRPAAAITARATTAVTGSRLVAPSGTYDGNFPVTHCGDGASPLGVASADIPSGQLGTLLREGVVPVTAGAAVTAGQSLQSDAQGRVVPRTTGRTVGLAVANGTTGLPTYVALSIT
ncbi:DUF2190 family protein [Gordonia alkanivorans]|uniref:DUF2190 family protein n=1 Tax=Gordonia alkanivorans TaxID=84096 RepID=UPI00244C39EC|nr:DUF2190 family protein [Gordonia alkanivorans]MDH3007095.1 DUF2190 family protein [Gordonia alkanivorans]MDH3015031.1 DUF2190 family protein [Gordonia alkanivorans]MDH3021618.1 DUF2190 family protein [Gordonia alkanivorans]MDH3040159.1 DUF2190 family protein [Gordonia alkanivorans]MDH3059417.1 DUF2190 family protein [Gordonia alkanivorans]